MTTDTDERGIVYVAMGSRFIDEATISADSAKSVMPDVPITLITDQETDGEVFDDVRVVENPRYDGGDRVIHAQHSPYDRTLFLDTDIYFTSPVHDIFDLLDSFDVASSINQRKFSSNRIDMERINELPEAFPEYNGGVMAYRQSPTTDEFLEVWKKIYLDVVDQGQTHNQAALRYALYVSDVRIATLTNEYNCVYRRAGSLNGPVKIFHGRLLDLDSYGAERVVDLNQAIEELNRQHGLRVYYLVGNRLKLAEPGLLERGITSLRDRGIIGTLRELGFLFSDKLP